MLRIIAALPIHAYRKWLSPKKGYKCAHNMLHSTGSCSDRVLSIIQNKPLLKWRSLIKNQFSECKTSARVIRDKRRKDAPCCEIADGLCDIADCAKGIG